MASSEKINQLQLLQQNLQNLASQKQQFQSQLMELGSALTELNSTEKSYRIVGKIMIAVPREKLEQELKEKKEMLDLRIKNFDQQEEKIQKVIDDLQKDIFSELKKEKK